ncbi:Uncharacterized protein TCM_007180 [Theobroma cacao]|uniref:Uncharacterized protein n=1 Tax=Theobroma cacao TaxID=3641 RepID=A0A061E0A3_THECC|nr:Uncharacterized protein TCM_007180 [Theobroma cacao]
MRGWAGIGDKGEETMAAILGGVGYHMVDLEAVARNVSEGMNMKFGVSGDISVPTNFMIALRNTATTTP